MNFINIHHYIYRILSLENRTPMKNSKSEIAKNLDNTKFKLIQSKITFGSM